MDTIIIIWSVVIIGFLIIEMVSAGFVGICFSIAGLAGLGLHFMGQNIYVQLIGFSVVLAVCLLFLMPFLKKLSNLKGDEANPISRTNLDLIIDMDGICQEKITRLEEGIVLVDGKEWTAMVKSDILINKGDEVIVKSIEGSKIIVEKKEGVEK